MVTNLDLTQSFQCSSNIKDWSRQHSSKKHSSLRNRQSWRLFSELLLQGNQKQMGYHHQRHVMIPSMPTTHGILIHPQFIFAVLYASLHWPSSCGKPSQFGLWRSFRSIGKIVSSLPTNHIVADNQTYLWARQCIPNCYHSYEGYISHQWSFATLMQGVPYILLWLKGYSIYLLGNRFTFHQFSSSSWTSTAFPGRNLCLWTLQPDTGVSWYLHKVKVMYTILFPHVIYLIQKPGIPTKFLVTQYPLEGNLTPLVHSLEHLQSPFLMVMEVGLFWYATILTTDGIFRRKPFFRKVKTAIQKCITLGGGVSQVDTHLAVIYLASGVTILTSYASRLSSLPWKSTGLNEKAVCRYQTTTASAWYPCGTVTS